MAVRDLTSWAMKQTPAEAVMPAHAHSKIIKRVGQLHRECLLRSLFILAPAARVTILESGKHECRMRVAQERAALRENLVITGGRWPKINVGQEEVRRAHALNGDITQEPGWLAIRLSHSRLPRMSVPFITKMATESGPPQRRARCEIIHRRSSDVCETSVTSYRRGGSVGGEIVFRPARFMAVVPMML
eukprot:scaffold274572_cov30-Tisochrysis_lutea.AAC.1